MPPPHEPPKPENPNQPPLNNQEEIKKYGEDYASLQPPQQEGRQKTQTSWTNKKNVSFLCLHCQKSFPYDKSIENYLEARNKAQKELNTHKASCADKNTTESKLKAQNWWSEVRKSKTRIIKTCEKCWGKVLWDKSIIDPETARIQALSDLKYHQDHECHLAPNQRKVAIYHSPNKGGNEHAPMDFSLLHPDADDGIYHFDQDGEVYQKQTQSPNGFNWKSPWVIGGEIVLVVGIVGLITYFWINKNKAKENS